MRIAALSPYAIATAGITRAVDRIDASAPMARDSLGDLVAATLERVEAESAVKANVAVLRSADEMTGRLLDILV